MTKIAKQISEKIPKKYKKGKFIKWVVGIVIVLAIVVLAINLTVQRTYNSYNIIKSKTRTDSNTKGYLSYNSNIIKYSTDGITVMGNDLKTLWNASYSFKNPSVVTCGDYVAVADIGGKEVNVYNKKGNVSKIENSREICQIEVSNTGMVAIMAREDMAYYITIANATKKYIDIKTRIKEDGYPLDMAFSPDSQKLVTSYMNIDKGEVNNYVTFYNFGEVGKNYESKIVKADSYGTVMVPKVEFIDNNTVCVFSQERFTIYYMKQTPEEKFKSKKYNKMIKSVICKDDYIGVVTDDESGDYNVIELYTKDGRKKLTKNVKYDYDTITMIKNDIIMSTRNDAMIIRASGKIKYKGEFKEEVEYIMPYNNRDKFYFITPQNIDRIKFANK